jgi:hypothetical protein
MKRYRCTQCSGHETRSLVADLLGSAPEACSNCGNREFEEVSTVGRVHSLLEGMGS